MALTILIANQKCRPLGELKLKLRMVKTVLLDQTTEVFLQLVSRAASDNAPVRNRHDLATQNYLPSPSPSPCSAYSYSSMLFHVKCRISNLQRNPTLSAVSTMFCVILNRYKYDYS